MEKEKELLDKIEKIEKALKDKDEEIKTLKNANTELSSKVASAKVDGLVRAVEDTQPTKPVEDEEVSFDFDY